MRVTLILAAALLLTPAVTTTPVSASGLQTAQATDLSASSHKKKARKAAAKPKEEYLKAAPGTGPSGPKK